MKTIRSGRPFWVGVEVSCSLCGRAAVLEAEDSMKVQTTQIGAPVGRVMTCEVSVSCNCGDDERMTHQCKVTQMADDGAGTRLAIVNPDTTP